MPYLPRPDVARTTQDVDEIYLLTVEELRSADTPEKRRIAFHKALMASYAAGADAQRDIVNTYAHLRPTPLPPPPGPEEEADPGLLPDGPRGRIVDLLPHGVAYEPGKPWRRG